jgi:hypothetical protein
MGKAFIIYGKSSRDSDFLNRIEAKIKGKNAVSPLRAVFERKVVGKGDYLFASPGG